MAHVSRSIEPHRGGRSLLAVPVVVVALVLSLLPGPALAGGPEPAAFITIDRGPGDRVLFTAGVP